ncbi:hypothetical protein IGB42_01984 [Andreprevotia sp. IGB-42]|nr:hypothetical protein IGB42_01984 [Andreprevotia sp. IGB-42]
MHFHAPTGRCLGAMAGAILLMLAVFLSLGAFLSGVPHVGPMELACAGGVLVFGCCIAGPLWWRNVQLLRYHAADTGKRVPLLAWDGTQLQYQSVFSVPWQAITGMQVVSSGRNNARFNLIVLSVADAAAWQLTGALPIDLVHYRKIRQRVDATLWALGNTLLLIDLADFRAQDAAELYPQMQQAWQAALAANAHPEIAMH